MGKMAKKIQKKLAFFCDKKGPKSHLFSHRNNGTELHLNSAYFPLPTYVGLFIKNVDRSFNKIESRCHRHSFTQLLWHFRFHLSFHSPTTFFALGEIRSPYKIFVGAYDGSSRQLRWPSPPPLWMGGAVRLRLLNITGNENQHIELTKELPDNSRFKIENFWKQLWLWI